MMAAAVALNHIERPRLAMVFDILAADYQGPFG